MTSALSGERDIDLLRSYSMFLMSAARVFMFERWLWRCMFVGLGSRQPSWYSSAVVVCMLGGALTER